LAFTIMLEMPRLEAFLISIPISLVNFELPGIKLQVLWPVVALLDFLESILTSLTSATSPSATCVFIAPLMTLMGMAVSMPLLVILLASDFLGIVATSQVVARENKKTLLCQCNCRHQVLNCHLHAAGIQLFRTGHRHSFPVTLRHWTDCAGEFAGGIGSVQPR